MGGQTFCPLIEMLGQAFKLGTPAPILKASGPAQIDCIGTALVFLIQPAPHLEPISLGPSTQLSAPSVESIAQPVDQEALKLGGQIPA